MEGVTNMPREQKYDPVKALEEMNAGQVAAEAEGVQRGAAQDKRAHAQLARDNGDEEAVKRSETEAQRHEELADKLAQDAEPYTFGRRGEDAASGTGKRYRVLHDGISGGHRGGDVIFESQFPKDTNFDHMLRVGAIEETDDKPVRVTRIGETPTPTRLSQPEGARQAGEAQREAQRGSPQSAAPPKAERKE